jgi:DNA polymerase-1
MGLARGYGIKFTREEARELLARWFEAWPEWVDYFKYVRSHIDRVSGTGRINQLRVKRVRGGVTYTSACNTLFQGLGADGAKHALYEVQKRCYVRHEGSVLYGARPVGFIHDEILAEVDEEIAHEQATEMARVMEDACNVYLPDVPVKCEPTLAKRWSKDIEAVYNRDGRLQPWDLAKEGRWEVYYGDGERVVWK